MKVVFVPLSFRLKSQNDYQALKKEFKKKGCCVYIITTDVDKLEIIDEYEILVPKDSIYEQIILRVADYLFDTGNMTVSRKYNKKQKWVWLWHGIPYKRLYATPFISSKAFDAIASFSEFYLEQVNTTFDKKTEILQINYPRSETLENEKFNLEKIRQKIGISVETKVALYCPTFRPYEHDFSLKKEELDSFPDDYVFLYRGHFMSEGLNVPNVIDVTNYDNLDELLFISNIVITDYSSILFDSAILKKATYFLQRDYDKYIETRGLNFKMEDFVDEKYIFRNRALKYVDEKDNLLAIRNEFIPNKYISIENFVDELLSKVPNKSPRGLKMYNYYYDGVDINIWYIKLNRCGYKFISYYRLFLTVFYEFKYKIYQIKTGNMK